MNFPDSQSVKPINPHPYERTNCHSNQRHHRVSCTARPARFRHDDRAAEFAQRRLFRVQRHDSGDGHLLRRQRASHRRHHGIKKSNTFAATAFISYGFFWLSLVCSDWFCRNSVLQHRLTTWRWPRIWRCGVCSPASCLLARSG